MNIFLYHSILMIKFRKFITDTDGGPEVWPRLQESKVTCWDFTDAGGRRETHFSLWLAV